MAFQGPAFQEPLNAAGVAAQPDLDATSARGQTPRGNEANVERLFELTSDLLATISLEGRFTLLNPAWEKLLGWTREELQAAPLEEFMHPDDIEQTLERMQAGEREEEQVETFTNRYRHRDGSWRWLLWSARRDEDTWYAAAKDVTDRMWLERQALHDPLTKLPNRLLLLDRAAQAVARLHRSEGVVAMLFIDLDKFKAVNDNLGHEAGDQLLVGTSARLLELMRDSDTVARLGGDEFVILAEDLESESEALALARRVIDAVQAPFPLKSTEVAMLASVGVAVAHDHEADPETLLREADVAMYRAKHAGGQRAELFDDHMRAELTTNVQIEGALRNALPQDELELVYQPIMPLAGGKALGCEALVRWRRGSPEQGARDELLLPAAFLPPAEESELIVEIGSWVLHNACLQADRWRRNGIAMPVFVNVSARELTELDLAGRVRDELTRCRLPGRALCLEVSEESVQRDPERARAALKEVKRLGVSIALDRFGSGKYSLGLPPDLPLDMVKLDRGLVASFDRNKEKRAMFAATIALARQASLTAIAVGIETSRQLALARELDCSVGQGFLLHKPTRPERLRLRRTAGSVRSAPWRTTVRLGGG
jgi:diguanylate cyclase (GGDEF)-like protein/PAS domain S-box-containing protein